LVVKLERNPELPPKTPVKVGIGELDYWDISGHFTLLQAPASSAQSPVDQASPA